MVMKVTPEEQEKFKELNKLRMKTYRDKTRVRKYSPRLKTEGKEKEA